MNRLKNLIVVGLAVLVGSPAFIFCVPAKDYELNGYTEVGKRSTAEDYEEEDSDDDYVFHNYHLRFKHNVSDLLNYNISSFIYHKNYKYTDSLDNVSRIFKAGWTYYIKQQKEESLVVSEVESLRFNFRFNYKTKRYENTPKSEFDQITVSPSLTFKKKDRYTVDFALGIDKFSYPVAVNKDLLKFFVRLGGKKYFDSKKLMFISAIRFEQADQSEVGRKKSKLEFVEGLDYKFALPWMHRVTTRFKWGARDTRDDVERSEDYDYGYFRYHLKTNHKISSKVKTDLKYQYFKKDYITAQYDHKGYYIFNGWDYDFLNDKRKRIWFNLDGEHKDVRYEDRVIGDYKKETVGLTASYQKKKNWKVSAGTKGNFYDYRVSTKDKKRYYATLTGEKLFLEGRLTTTLKLKYRHTSYDLRNDTDYETVRFAFKYRF